MAKDEHHPRHFLNEIGRPDYIAHDASFWALHRVFQQLEKYQELFDDYGATLEHIPVLAGESRQLIHNQVDLVLRRATEKDVQQVFSQLVDDLESEIEDRDLVSSLEDGVRSIRKLDDGQFELRIPIYFDFAYELGAHIFDENSGGKTLFESEVFGKSDKIDEKSEEAEQEDNAEAETDIFVDLMAHVYGRALYIRNAEENTGPFEETLEKIRVLLSGKLSFKVRLMTSEEVTAQGPRRKIQLKLAHAKSDILQARLFEIAALLEEEELPPEAAHWIINEDAMVVQNTAGKFIAVWTIYQDYLDQNEFADRHSYN